MGFVSFFYTVYNYWHLRLHGATIGKKFVAGGPLDILLRDGASLKNLTIGDDVTLQGRTYVRMRSNGKIVVRNGVTIGTEVWLVTANDAEFVIGEKTIIGPYSIFNAGHGIEIGRMCIFGAFIYMNSSEHHFKKGEFVQNQGFYGSKVTLGDDVWLGGHVMITKGVRIGDGVVIGGGSVVTKDVPENKIAFGNPARAMKDRV